MNIEFPEEIKFIIDKLGDARIVGGFVRDSILGSMSNDIDIVTPLLPHKVIEKLEKFAKLVPTGIKHGTVTAIYNSVKTEITTIRKDVSCDGRHAKVIFSNDYKEDAKRRDFTINAMSYCIANKKIYDYFSGMDDLQSRRVVFVGYAKDRIEEDYLRILRFFRFSDRYAQELDQEALHYCLIYKDQLKRLSIERISSELLKLLSYAKNTNVIRVLYERKFLDFCIDCSWKIEALDKAFSLGLKMDIHTKLAILFEGLSLAQMKYIKIPSRHIQKINLIKNTNPIDIDIFCYKYSYDLAVQMLIYYYAFGLYDKADIEGLMSSLQSIKNKADMPIDGSYLLSIGYSGKDVGIILKKLEGKWIKENFSVDDLKNYINSINKKL